ncbi:MAG: extracellular solute-binding protein [Chloroflexota bacterium]|nr:extracellular solute-binding protein [Chloroflexota bacterium]
MAILLSGCDSLLFEIPWLKDEIPTETQPVGEESELTSTPALMPTEETTPVPVTSLTLWVPPEMDPSMESDASKMLANRLQLFSDLHNGLEVKVRVKAASGAGGLLDALDATNAAAPDALPDLIVFSRPDMESAALKGLISSLEALTEVPDDSDWYSFTRDLALLQGETYGFPFAADALALVYRPEIIPDFSGTWNGILESNAALVFPADSDHSLFQLVLYLDEGGVIQDNQRRPTLEVDALSEVFQLIQEGVESGTFPQGLIQYQTSDQVWAAFKEGEADLVVTWMSNFLRDGPGDAAVLPLFPVSDGAVSIGTGLIWAVSTPIESRQDIVIDLAEFLIQSDFLAEWSLAAGYIPPRPSSLEGWTDQGLRSTVSQIALMTQMYPSNEIITKLGPVLREGTRQILQEMVDPTQAAQEAVESLEE